MAKPIARIGLIEAVLVLGALAVLGRAAQLQLVQGAKWQAEAERVRREKLVLPARRGGIFDRNGVALALTQEYFEVGVAPNELRERARDARTIARALGLSLSQVQRDLATRKWAAYRGPYNGLRGAGPAPAQGRVPRWPVLPALSGGASGARRNRRAHTGQRGRGERSRAGAGFAAHRSSGRGGRPQGHERKDATSPPPALAGSRSAGRDVFLTLDAELQEIAERALEDAMTEFEAIGGDIVVLDPRTGELLALASRQTVEGKRGREQGVVLHRPIRARLHREAVHCRCTALPQAREVDGSGLRRERAVADAGQLARRNPVDP